MMRRHLLLLSLLVMPAACGSMNSSPAKPAQAPPSKSAPEPSAASAPATTPAPASAPAEDPLTAMRTSIAELQARPEIQTERVKVQHILISFKGAPRVPATRSKEDAEKLAADVFARIHAGESFQKLMETYSDDDKEVGVYLMTATAPTNPPTSYNRHDMVPAFGETGWRLQVGEVGVAPWNAAKSPYGWHIVKRLE